MTGENGVKFQLNDHERRLGGLERGETGPAPVINEKLTTLAREVRGIKWVFGIFTGAFVSGVVTLVVFLVTSHP